MSFLFNYHKQIIVGGSGSGKTTLANFFMLQALAQTGKIMIVDTNLEIATRLSLPSTRDIKLWSPSVPCYYPRQYSINQLEYCIKRARQFTNLCLMIDDLDAYTGGQYYSGQELNTLMVNGRHQNLGVIITMKRPVNIPLLVIQQAHYVSLFNINARDFPVLADWNLSLNYPDNKLQDFLQLKTFTFGFFVPRDKENINATDPKVFSGFYELPKEQAK